jgi:uncharacterized membrane protein YkvA (DUF1232 family)
MLSFAMAATSPLVASKRRPRGITILPFLGDLVAMTRLLRDGRAALWAKLLVVAAMLYVVFPFDVLPDLAPLAGWIDDVGLVVVLRLLLYRQVEPYRYPFFGKRPAALDPAAPLA